MRSGSSAIGALALFAVVACEVDRGGKKETPPAQKLNAEGWQLVERGYHAEGAAKLEDAVKLAPEDPQIRQNLCNAWIMAEQPAKALHICERAAELSPQDAYTHYLVGVVSAQLAHNERASAALRTSIQLDPKYASAHSDLAQVLLASAPNPDQVREALAAARKAFELGADHPEFEVGLVKALSVAGECEEAAKRIESLQAAKVDVAELRVLHYERCAKD